ncbi:MAG: hypothetical protein KJ990_07460 [Proteobacteria bacterium]|nr:hypothetical protein [Pseudomonadota bacterium]MBU1648997.1 hypothetical protein [Pseudomonadota bacterium]MBU1986193.1 hypothetical protein [Pseudomonadota bacterium]
MATTNVPTKEASHEQIQYAKILEKGMFTGLLLMCITFVLYVFGLMQPLIPLHDIPTLWSTKSGVYLTTVENNYIPEGHSLKVKVQAQQEAAVSVAQQGHEAKAGQHVLSGWSWATLLGYSDFLNFLPVAILAGITILCYGVIIPGLFARGDKAMGIMAIVEIGILVLAASGILRVGGH